jgi:N-hydroxyarylamine O-acetyltransferase
MSDDANIDAYFERIGFSGSIAPTLQTLEALHHLHPAAIPFENLDPLSEVPVRLELRNLEQKLLFEKRGGYCLEHNLLFKAMLEDLGFEVTGLAASNDWGKPVGDETERLSHMVLRVDIGGVAYLADVGFGAATLTAPLRLRADTEQATPHEAFRLVGGDPTWQLQMQIGDAWRPVYSFTEAEKTLDDYAGINDMMQGDAMFRDRLVASRAEKGRRISLSNDTLKIHPTGGDTETRTLGGLAEVKDVLTTLFGIAVPASEKLDAAIERVIAGPAI